MALKLKVNGEAREVPDSWREESLLMTLREQLGLTGAKFGCGAGLCGACTVHLDGVAIRSCITATKDAAGASITTIEGLAGADGKLHPIQQSWIEHRVPQCGYCQAGQMMQAASLLNGNFNPSDEEIVQHMSGNLCRCGTYDRIKKAIKAVPHQSVTAKQ